MSIRIRRRLLIVGTALGLGWGVAGPASAQSEAPLRIVVGFPPGGSADTLARALAERMAVELKRSVIVENKPGAAARLAVNDLKRAAPDGLTVMLAPVVVTVLAPLVYRNLPYKAGDFAPVGHVVNFEFGLAVHPSESSRTVKDLMASMKQDATRANYGFASPGSLPHFFGVMLAQQSGSPLVGVPFNGGAPLMNALIGGQVNVAINEVGSQAEFHRTGKIKVLATFGKKRSALLPEVPTIGEQGLQGAEGSGWYGLYAPAATPTGVIDQLNAAMNAALRSPRMADVLTRQGFEAAGGQPEALTKLEAQETKRWAPVVQASGFKVD
jgi:tripartite-type tricarboxylate transporter receptor subunit TctC